MLQRLLAAEVQESGMGPDNPERERMEAMRYRAYGDAVRAARRAAGEVFGEVLTPAQLKAWVLGAAR
jgi:hypothetical protein